MIQKIAAMIVLSNIPWPNFIYNRALNILISHYIDNEGVCDANYD